MTESKTVQINIRTEEEVKALLTAALAEHNKVGPKISFNSFLVFILKQFVSSSKVD